MLYLLYHGGYETGFNLSKELKQEIGRKFIGLKGLGALKSSDIKRGDVLLRWGSTRRSEKDALYENRGMKILNSASSILRNTNKLGSLRLFAKAGLNVPKIYTDKHSIKGFPVLGRDRNHSGGKDIVIIQGSNNLSSNDFNKIPNKDFYVEFIPSKLEYRVHVFAGEVLRVTQKTFRGHDRNGDSIDNKSLIRNDTFGWGHSNIETNEVRKDILNACIKAVKAIGLDFGAVDVIISSVDEKPYILEVNTCPRLNSIGMKIYVDRIKELI